MQTDQARPSAPDNPADDAYLRAVVKAYSRQVPLLYVILSVGAVALATSYWNVAPTWLVTTAPALLLVVCVIRLTTWARRSKRELTTEESRKALRSINVLGPVLGASFLLWIVALFGYGDPLLQAHAVFFCGFAVVNCTFCLLHARTAALGVTLAVVPAATIFLITRGEPTLTAIALNLAVVCAAMVRMVFVFSANFREMTKGQVETQRLSDENLRLANLDSLTGLPNRRMFFGRLTNLLGDTPAGTENVTVGLIDLDGFQPVNDLYGHVVGDHILMEVGRRLEALSTPGISFARLGGDEFGMLIETDIDDTRVLAIAARVCDAIEIPYEAPGALARLSASMGLAAGRDSDGSAERLYERADYALYHAKQNERGQPVAFSQAHEIAIRRMLLIERSLRSADLDEEMTLVYQPIVDVATGRAIAVEALARWSTPEIGMISPAEFITVAERTDLITWVTQTLLRMALSEMKGWPEDVCISFNLSARDLSPEAMLRIVSIVASSGVAPGRIVFEITETAAMRDFDLARSALAALKALGARIALDDFGSGYSSLNSVRRLPLDEIKIDRGFISGIETEDAARDIVKTMIDLCRNLDLLCVVEGVETAEHQAILRSLGCTTMQGYLFSKPIPAGQIAAYLDAEADRMEERRANAELQPPRRRSTVM